MYSRCMKLLTTFRHQLKKLYKDKLAQDLIEYALMAGFVAVTAGALMPGVSTSIGSIWSKLANMMVDAANTPNG